MQRLLETMRTLRAPGGCPWDREQTHASLRKYLLEEAAEAVDALATDDTAAVVEELGDVLLQVAFHAVIAEESGRFAYPDIETAITDKLERRHPHVFGDVQVKDADEVVANWHAIKAREKAQPSPAESVPHALPALLRASELGRKLAWPVLEKDDLVSAVAAAPATAAGVGDALLAVVAYARALGVDPELALRDAANRKGADAA
ncbi:MazG family protein [soil metagenome]